ncbi:hypothetical protein RND81_07G020800 [Saponaria officinalis]|uniref:Gamma-tubulin complex component n=1 Tax=Saponaria officinalis TaxID=3572 RepID=A0AAW1JJZ2_SAPOF
MEGQGPTSLINRIHNSVSDGIYLATSLTSLKTTEFDLVQGILHVLQGNSSQFFFWDEFQCRFYANVGVFVTHLSQTSLHEVLNQFLCAASCLRKVEVVVTRIEREGSVMPTLRAFASSVSVWLARLREVALKEEEKTKEPNLRAVSTLLGLANSLSSLCSGAEFLLQIVHEAVPKMLLESLPSIPAAEVAVHILDVLYKKLIEACLVQGGEEEAYKMLLFLFAGSILPYIECLDSWIHEGILDDPYTELFFYENKAVSINDTEFWEKSYLLRSITKQKHGEPSNEVSQQQACPLFLKDIAKEVVSAGKSLQLIRHVPMTLNSGCGATRPLSCKNKAEEINSAGKSMHLMKHMPMTSNLSSPTVKSYSNVDSSTSCGVSVLGEQHSGYSTAGLTLVELFFVSLAGIIGHGDHVYNYFLKDGLSSVVSCLSGSLEELKLEAQDKAITTKKWVEVLDSILQERQSCLVLEELSNGIGENRSKLASELESVKSFHAENPVIAVCHKLLSNNRDGLKTLNLSKDSQLPPLNDEDLWEGIFDLKSSRLSSIKQTNCAFGFQYSESQCIRSLDDTNFLETIFPLPTVLPSYQMSELLPLQKNSTLSSRILRWILVTEPKGTPLPVTVLQECLIVYIKKQVDIIGSHMLSKLLNDWRLIDELGVLRAIYLLGSGDLLQHFLTVIFNKLDKGESWDDDFELNMILQESIANSADSMLLSVPDALVVSIIRLHGVDGNDQHNPSSFVSTPRKSHEHGLGINGRNILNFTYKVSWPLELIANTEAIRKYNQVMHFLMKVKRAKFVLDKSRRWIWKAKGAVTVSYKHHWLVEQKLLHFVDAFHQYVMDRVYHSAWSEMCQGMASARSLDEVIEVHEAYLLSIQRQCFVVPDKLGALIASRVNTILGLALDFYSIQQTLNSSGTVSGIKARCEMELDRIEMQFDDCIAFLLRVLSFKLNVGHFPHLADLVTRINYNYFYMSDNGTMITAPGSESVKLPKTFPGRP